MTITKLDEVTPEVIDAARKSLKYFEPDREFTDEEILDGIKRTFETNGVFELIDGYLI